MRHFLIRVAAGVIEKDGRYFIARRQPGDSMAGFWEFPGGKVEDGETPEACLERELHEELGIRVRVGKLLARVAFPYRDGQAELLAYRVEHLSGEIVLNEHDAMAWVEAEELLEFQLAPADIPVAKLLDGSDPTRGT